MGLLERNTPFERASAARLVLDLDELSRVEWATLDFYASVRGIPTAAAARRSLFRLKKTLAAHGVLLEIKENLRHASARFGTREIAELIELDVRPARVLVERIDAEREGREPDLEELEHESDHVSPEVIRREYRERRKSFAWIGRMHGLGMGRVRRLVAATGPVPDPSLRRCVEERRPRAVVERALEAAHARARVAEIAAILGCTERTAQRFLRRHGFFLPPGRPRHS